MEAVVEKRSRPKVKKLHQIAERAMMRPLIRRAGTVAACKRAHPQSARGYDRRACRHAWRGT
jgi:hypothetical protein